MTADELAAIDSAARQAVLDDLGTSAEDAYKAVTRRNAAIVQAHDAGMSLRQIADAVGLSHMGVRKIIQRTEGN